MKKVDTVNYLKKWFYKNNTHDFTHEFSALYSKSNELLRDKIDIDIILLKNTLESLSIQNSFWKYFDSKKFKLIDLAPMYAGRQMNFQLLKIYLDLVNSKDINKSTQKEFNKHMKKGSGYIWLKTKLGNIKEEKLECSESVKLLEGKIFKNYTIVTPKTLKDLSVWSLALSNCLNTYTSGQISPDMNEIIGLSRNNKLKFAIQLRNNSVHTFLGFANSKPDLQMSIDFNSFLKKLGIKSVIQYNQTPRQSLMSQLLGTRDVENSYTEIVQYLDECVSRYLDNMRDDAARRILEQVIMNKDMELIPHDNNMMRLNIRTPRMEVPIMPRLSLQEYGEPPIQFQRLVIDAKRCSSQVYMNLMEPNRDMAFALMMPVLELYEEFIMEELENA